MAARRKQEHQARAWAAWHTAWLTAYAPRKSDKFLPFADLIGEPKRLPTAQSPQEMKAVFDGIRKTMRKAHGR